MLMYCILYYYVGGTSKSKVGVAGDSAGGQISASVSQHVPGLDFEVDSKAET